MSELLDLATRVVDRARVLGADEVAAIVSEGTHATIQRRAGQVEQATEATTLMKKLEPFCESLNALVQTEEFSKTVAESIAQGEGEAAYMNSVDHEKFFLAKPPRPAAARPQCSVRSAAPTATPRSTRSTRRCWCRSSP